MSLRRRFLTVLTTACALTLAAGTPGLAPTGTGSALAATTAPVGAPSFDLVSYNIRHALSDAVATADIQRLADAGADVIALQEMGSGTRRAAVRAKLVSCATCEFQAFMPTGAGPAEVPLLVRSSVLDLVASGTQKVSDATWVGGDGAGPSTMAPKYLTWVQLRHVATGQLLYVINNHTVPSVQAADGGPNWSHPERLQLFRQHMDGLSDLVRTFSATGAPVFTAGDFNVNWRRDAVVQARMFPFYRMSEVGVHASFEHLGAPAEGTHVSPSGGGDTRLIDQVSASDHPAIVASEQAILRGYSSDHRPVRVRYSIASAPGAPATVGAEPLERSARVSWSAATSASSYTVTTVQTGAQVTVPGTATSTVVTGLVPGTSYTFRVEAANQSGRGTSSPESNAVVPFALAPDTTMTTGPTADRLVTSTEATFGYRSTLAGTTFACTLDGVELPCGATGVRLTALTPGTHTFAVAARDADGDADVSPATRSWTVPVASTQLRHSASWSVKPATGYYGGAYAVSSTRHGVVSRVVSGMRRLALVATTGPGQGVVKVYVGDTLLKQVDLAARTLTRTRVLPVARFDTALSGKVRVVVASSGKPVRVEGLGVATR